MNKEGDVIIQPQSVEEDQKIVSFYLLKYSGDGSRIRGTGKIWSGTLRWNKRNI